MAIETILKAFNMVDLQAQDYSKDNLFQLRKKVLSVI